MLLNEACRISLYARRSSQCAWHLILPDTVLLSKQCGPEVNKSRLQVAGVERIAVE